MGMPDKVPRLIGSHDHQIHTNSQAEPSGPIATASEDDPLAAEELQQDVFMLLLGHIHDLLSSAVAAVAPPPRWRNGKMGENDEWS